MRSEGENESLYLGSCNRSCRETFAFSDALVDVTTKGHALASAKRRFIGLIFAKSYIVMFIFAKSRVF